ncbi:MAG: flagellar export chaperone FliS [Armatimonadota bacterium]|nr:flagellar export chaperone FliS [Armatimonadota bacterium]
MAAPKDAPQAYQQMQVLGSDPRQLVVLLCQAVVTYLRRAERAIKARDYQTKSDALCRAQAIFSELICSLDTEIGEDLAERLRALYAHLQRQLVDVDLQDDLDRLAYVTEIAEKLGDAWEEALRECQDEESEAA